eukprot:sb/3479192/
MEILLICLHLQFIHVTQIKGTPGVFQRRVPNLTIHLGLGHPKWTSNMQFQPKILTVFFATAYFQSGVFSTFDSIFDVRTKFFEIETSNSWDLKRI